MFTNVTMIADFYFESVDDQLQRMITKTRYVSEDNALEDFEFYEEFYISQYLLFDERYSWITYEYEIEENELYEYWKFEYSKIDLNDVDVNSDLSGRH